MLFRSGSRLIHRSGGLPRRRPAKGTPWPEFRRLRGRQANRRGQNPACWTPRPAVTKAGKPELKGPSGSPTLALIPRDWPLRLLDHRESSAPAHQAAARPQVDSTFARGAERVSAGSVAQAALLPTIVALQPVAPQAGTPAIGDDSRLCQAQPDAMTVTAPTSNPDPVKSLGQHLKSEGQRADFDMRDAPEIGRAHV